MSVEGQTLNDSTIEKFKCWINKEAKILSFHFVEGFIEKAFSSETLLKQYAYELAGSYRVQ